MSKDHNKPLLQDEPNKPDFAKEEPNEKDLDKVSGGHKNREQEQPENEMAH